MSASSAGALRYAPTETASPRGSATFARDTLPVPTSQSWPQPSGAGQQQQQQQPVVRRARANSAQNNYKKLIASHAERSPKRGLFFGAHFTGLRNLLTNTPDTPAPPASSGRDFPYVVVRDVTAGGGGSGSGSGSGSSNASTLAPAQPFGAATGHDAFAAARGPADGGAQVVFVRGFPSPRWVSALGHRLQLDPDFFRMHLGFLDETNYYTEPAWPSLAGGFLRLRLPTIMQRQSPLLRPEVEYMRRREFSGPRDYQKSLRWAGESIVRRMCVLDDLTFAVEQEIIIGVTRRSTGGAWTAVVWLDHGKVLPFDDEQPWQKGTLKQRKANSDHETDCVPLPQHLPPKLLYQPIGEVSAIEAGDPLDVATHGGFFLPYGFGATLKPELLRNDPFYALSEILKFAVNSQNQFLNRINHGVNETMELLNRISEKQETAATTNEKKMWALTDLNYSRRLIADSLVYLEDLEAFMDMPSHKFWGRLSNPEAIELREETKSSIMMDLRCGIRRAKALSDSTTEGMAFITNGIMLVDSRLAIAKADVMHRLTLLACLFLPLSFTVSFFGTNVTQFGSGSISIWVVIVTFVPITFLVLVICFWAQCFAILKVVWRWGEDRLYPWCKERWHSLLDE